ncbi:hypothetical protein [Streptomyces sp. P17]|uniref:hypothetical protein n=1 Tax=Streptomyces sp. P17 TaxID=3074716 RepID=UPI0028F3ECA7|nr:hypothetical protein [Streptomyces sp. P17]MDT9701856.1 hypothetical protein [Streptomyces sp. P17]
MGIGTRHASTGAATAALLLCFGTAGTAAAEEVPADDLVVSADETTDINDRQGWEDETDQPIDERETRRCTGPDTWYEFSSKKAYHVPSWWNGTKYKDGPGGTMSVSVTKSGTIALEISGSGEWSAGVLLAKAKTTISAKITGTVAVTTGHTYTHEISRNKYGHLQYGSWGYKASWKRYKSVGNGCGAPMASRRVV